MTKHNSYLKVKCKCSPDCTLLPTINYNGFAYSHASEELKDKVKAEKGTKHRQSIRNRQNKANLTKRLWLAQKKVGVPKMALKCQKTPIPKASKKRLAELRIYRVLRKDFLKDHPNCECGLPDCNKGKSYDIHHLYMGRDRGKYFLVVETWKAVSRKDHNRLHNEFSTEQLISFGLRKLG